jgi:hydroxymethylbilane synthase
MPEQTLHIGTRGSALARWQANWVAEALKATSTSCTLVEIATHGDQRPDDSIGSLGADGVFVKELQKALLDGRIDVAVHSLKDLPTDPVPGIALAAVPQRQSPFDALVSRDRKSLQSLPSQARIATGSIRRRAQLLHARPDLQMVDVRGNVDTRLRKLDEGQFDALILAEAGLNRLGLANRITELLRPPVLWPAVGQGALGIETRTNDHRAHEAVAAIDDPETHQCVIAERNLLAALRGGCLAPIGALATIEDDGRLHLSATVLSPDGKRRLTADRLGNAADAVQIARTVAEQLLADGAAKLIDAARGLRL